MAIAVRRAGRLRRHSSGAWPLQAYFALLVAVFLLAAAAGAAYVVVQSERDARADSLRTLDFSGAAGARDLGQEVAVVRSTVAQLAANPGIAQVFKQPA